MMKRVVLFFAFMVFAVPVFAGVSVGDKIPHTLESLDQNGEAQNFESVKGEKGAVLVFVRSLDWCPYCQRQVLTLVDISDVVMHERGYNIVTISYDAPEKLKKFSDKHKSPFVSLSDPKSEIIQAFDILNDGYEKSSRFYGIPQPHVYVVNTEGVVQHVLSEEGFKVRPSNEKILKAVLSEE